MKFYIKFLLGLSLLFSLSACSDENWLIGVWAESKNACGEFVLEYRSNTISSGGWWEIRIYNEEEKNESGAVNEYITSGDTIKVTYDNNSYEIFEKKSDNHIVSTDYVVNEKSEKEKYINYYRCNGDEFAVAKISDKEKLRTEKAEKNQKEREEEQNKQLAREYDEEFRKWEDYNDSLRVKISHSERCNHHSHKSIKILLAVTNKEISPSEGIMYTKVIVANADLDNCITSIYD